MKTRLPRPIYDLLWQAGRCADAVGVSVYVVGGFVRDLLLGVENDDVDLVVEGDGIAFAEIVSKEMGGVVTTHKEFNTATIAFRSGLKIDGTDLCYFFLPLHLPLLLPSFIISARAHIHHFTLFHFPLHLRSGDGAVRILSPPSRAACGGAVLPEDGPVPQGLHCQCDGGPTQPYAVWGAGRFLQLAR